MKELATALSEFQAELVIVGKTAENPFFRSKYADLASIMLAAQPVLTKHGLSIVQLPSNIDGHPALTTIVLHSSGQSIEATVPLILAKNDPQGVGSAITYARRYGYAAALQIVIDEDDDGNRAAQSVQRGQTYNPAPDTGMANQAQKEAIKRRLDKLGISMEKSKAYLKEEYDVDSPLTKADAAKVLDAMITGDK